MKIIIVIMILFLIGQKTHANYEPTSLPQLIIESDLIVQGKIVRQHSMTFVLVISDWIKGNYNLHSIRIKKFEDWECANRIPTYQIGQEEIAFLKANNKTKEWITMGAGDEGELVIQNDSIIYPNIYWDFKSGCSMISFYGTQICGWTYSKDDFKNAIWFYINEFPKLKKDYENDNSIPNRLKDNKAYSRMIFESFDYIVFRKNG